MTPVFADTLYWYALANRRDQWHSAVLSVRARIGARSIVTTEEVLTELLAALSSDAFLRAAAKTLVEALFADDAVTVLPQTHRSFTDGFAFYNSRPDKEYSLTDCISMNACRAGGISEVLTNDHHFTQEGFVILVTP